MSIQTVMVLVKGEYRIRVKKHPDDSYVLEFSKDKFKTFTPKPYPNRDALREVLEEQFELEELIGI